MKAVWSGRIMFGTIGIPVRLFSAVQDKGLRFRVLHGKCGTPLNYKKWCPKCEEEVPWEKVSKGIEFEPGKFAMISEEELDEFTPEKSKNIEITGFIPKDSMEPFFIKNHYHAVPDGENRKAYFLLKEALLLTEKIATGIFAMRGKEYVCIIYPYKKVLMLTTLNYEDEIRSQESPAKFGEPPELGSEELSLAKMMIEKMTKEKFEISEFKDSLTERVKTSLKER